MSQKGSRSNIAARWFPLDTAGAIYPAARTRRSNFIFRLSFLLKEEIHAGKLRQALKELHPRFPSFFVGVRNGLFWYYLERMDNHDILRREQSYPCRPMNIFSRKTPCVRVLYDHQRIALEFSHCIADGGAALVLSRALITRYLELRGVTLPENSERTDLQATPLPEELADSYKEYYHAKTEKPRHGRNAWQYRPRRIFNYLKLIHGTIPLEDILPVVKQRGLSLTDYLLCALLYAFYTALPQARRSRKPLKITIPISLRTLFPSKSLRNFMLYSNLGFDPSKKKNFTFDEIVKTMRGKLDAAKCQENMHKLLCEFVRNCDNLFIRWLPNFIKRHIMSLYYSFVVEGKSTSFLSNLGKAGLPPEVEAQVHEVNFIVGGPEQKRLCSAVISDSHNLHICFTGDTLRTEVQREFFRLLRREGLRAHVESNIRDEFLDEET